MRRGGSGLSLVVGVIKESGMTSHDVVNCCRRIFAEKRVGHAGTLDPMAEGVLPVCVGPATRLAPYLSGHDKRYRFRVSFGAATDTDDAQGAVTAQGKVPDLVYDGTAARAFVSALVGSHRQVPPAYSAIKVGGQRSYRAARAGTPLDLAARDIEVYGASLEGILADGGRGYPAWDISVHVSKGTYIRALARDLGAALGCPAHVGSLERTSVGVLGREGCRRLGDLEAQRERAALDPAVLLGFPVLDVTGPLTDKVRNGNALMADGCDSGTADGQACFEGACLDGAGVHGGDSVTVVADNRVVAVYAYEGKRAMLAPRCVFSIGVLRG